MNQSDRDIVLCWRCVTNESLWPPLLLNRSVQAGWKEGGGGGGGGEGVKNGRKEGGWAFLNRPTLSPHS